MGINPADNLTAPQAIETIRQLLKLSGSRGRDNNWLLNEIAKHVSKFTPLAELAARREPGPGAPMKEHELMQTTDGSVWAKEFMLRFSERK
jgi:hypothetical protein